MTLLAQDSDDHYSPPVTDEDLSKQLASLRLQREPQSSGTGVNARSELLHRWPIVAGLVAVGGVGYALFHQTQARIFPEEVELGAVTLVSPTQENVTLVATGYVQARRRAVVAPKVMGRLAKLLVDEGHPVKEGQLLAQLDSTDAEAAYYQVRAEVAAARARIEGVRADLADVEARHEREAKLLSGAASTQAAVDDLQARALVARAHLATTQAEMAAVEARLGAAQVVVENTRIRAPFSGTVVRKLVEVGEVVAPAGAGLFILADLSDLEVHADVSEAQLAKLQATTPTEILLDAFPDRRFRGEVREIRQTVDRAKAAVTAKVKFHGDVQGVLPDMAAKVSFLSHPLDEAALQLAPKLVVPADAVVERSGRQVVLMVNDGRVREMVVTTGGPVGAMVELKSGPSTGTRVIRHPADRLHEGSSAQEKESK